MGRYRSRSRSYSPRRGKRYDDPRESRSRRDRRSPAPSGLLVRNISLDARPEDLRIPFERFGPIKDVYLPKNYYTGEPRGFGFVKFRYPEDAADAKDHLNHTVIGGLEEEATGGEVQQGPQDAAIAKLCKGSGTAGPGMIITLHADLDLFQDQFHHPLMREIIGQTRSPQGIPDPFQGLFLHARREITGQTTGPQARERMVVVPVMRGMMNPAGHRALGEMGGVPQGLIHDPTVLADGCST
ncbi:hypothetical protein HYC85_019337 [Camellia sinensis]|uniref:RRM domain-containing protein n=1 Tax=Camellia sinensis TaxID=4442 RepID=A0A7J7GN70_CAMSI|nr:hypothetical protein HYC85_019337 [Camellia sinensis]